MVKIVVIAGAIGSGKSTALEAIQTACLSADIGVTVNTLDEPVTEWMNDNGFDWLSTFYENPLRWSFSFQVKILMSVTLRLRKALNECASEEIKTGKQCVLLTERSILDGLHVFVPIAAEMGRISPAEFDLYQQLVEELNPPMPDGLLYVHCPAERCYTRIAARGRDGEQAIDASYCSRIADKYLEVSEKKLLGKEYVCFDNGLGPIETLPERAMHQFKLLINKIF